MSRVAATLAAAVLGLAGCGGSASSTADGSSRAAPEAPAGAARTVVDVDGFPLVRTLDALVRMRGVDTIVVVADPRVGAPAYTGTDRPGDGWDAPGDGIVTPVDATVAEVLRGTATVGDPVRMVHGAGRIGDHETVASTEVSPRLEDVATYSRLVVAGETVSTPRSGEHLSPWFVYGLDADGRARSLMESAGDERYPSFPISSLRDAVRGR